MLLDDTLEGFWLSRRRNLSQNTVRDYELTFRRFREFVGNREFDTITAEDVNRFLDHIRYDLKLSDKSVSNHWVALSALWTWADRTLKTEHVIRGQVERPKHKRRQSAPYTEEDVRKLLESCETARVWSSIRT